jgi:hypothetical protein
MDVELTNQRPAWNFGLILNGDVILADVLAAAARAGVGQRRFETLIDALGRRRRPMAVRAVLFAGFASGSFGIGLGRPFGKRRRLPLAGSLTLFEQPREPLDLGFEFGNPLPQLDAFRARRLHAAQRSKPRPFQLRQFAADTETTRRPQQPDKRGTLNNDLLSYQARLARREIGDIRRCGTR